MKYQFRIFMDFEFLHSCIHTSTVNVDYSCHCTLLIAPCCVSFLVTFGLDQKKSFRFKPNQNTKDHYGFDLSSPSAHVNSYIKVVKTLLFHQKLIKHQTVRNIKFDFLATPYFIPLSMFCPKLKTNDLNLVKEYFLHFLDHKHLNTPKIHRLTQSQTL